MKQTITALNAPLQAKVMIPGSKSMTNRALLLAALGDGVSEIFDILISDDTRAFVQALHVLGIAIQMDETTRSCIVAGCGGNFPRQQASIWCEGAGTVARFLVAACAASQGRYNFDGLPQLCQRPIAPLLQVLTGQGAKLLPKNAKHLPFVITTTDKLHGGTISVDGSQSGQFLSALLMAAPFFQTTTTIEATALVSSSYVEMTVAMMAEFGVLVRRLHRTRFLIPVPQRYQALDYVVEPDLSTASYFFAAAAVTGGEVTIQAIDREQSSQGDVQFLTVLEKMGCQVLENTSGLTVKGTTSLKGVNVDMRSFSDTFMTLAAIAPFASTPTTITNIRHTRYQESNRIESMRAGLEKLQIKVESGEDWIKIYPGTPQPGVIDSHHDHRIAMSFAIIGLKIPGVEIEGAECVSKTCPDFFKMWERLV